MTGIYSRGVYGFDFNFTNDPQQDQIDLAEYIRGKYGVRIGTEICADAAEYEYVPTLIAHNGLKGDALITIWDCDGAKVADTNGGSVWCDISPEAFAELASRCNNEV